MPKAKKKNLHSQRYIALAKNINADQTYSIAEAIELVRSNSNTKFNESVDVSLRLGIDPKKGDQNVRGTTTIPHGTGKVKRVAVLAKGDLAKEAEEAGADSVGAEDLITKIQNGFKDFDVLLAAEDMAPQIGKIGKILGQRTPNKRNGTVTNSIANAVKEIKSATRIEYRADKGGIVHVPLGRVSFSADQITENFNAALSAVGKAKPTTAKGRYLLSATLSSTMGPGVKLDLAEVQKVAGVI